MFWSKPQKKEPLPWYRELNYKGKLTEREKRVFDSFRMQEKHPAADYQSLRNEVQEYIVHLEAERYQLELGRLVQGCLIVFALGCYFTYWAFREDYIPWTLFGPSTALSLFFGIVFLSVPPVYYWRTSKKLIEKFIPDGDWAYNTNEALKKEWELNFLRSRDFSRDAQ